eukprot:3000-Heterococcus_DN1.PRE.4
MRSAVNRCTDAYLAYTLCRYTTVHYSISMHCCIIVDTRLPVLPVVLSTHKCSTTMLYTALIASSTGYTEIMMCCSSCCCYCLLCIVCSSITLPATFVLPKVAVSMCLGDSASVAASAADVADRTDDGCDCFQRCSCDFSYARSALRPLVWLVPLLRPLPIEAVLNGPVTHTTTCNTKSFASMSSATWRTYKQSYMASRTVRITVAYVTAYIAHMLCTASVLFVQAAVYRVNTLHELSPVLALQV